MHARQAIRGRGGQVHVHGLAHGREVESGGLLHIGGSDLHFLKEGENLADELGIAADGGGVFFPRGPQFAFMIGSARSGETGQHPAAAGDHLDEIAVQFPQLGEQPRAARRTGTIPALETLARGTALFGADGPVRAAPFGAFPGGPFGPVGTAGSPFGTLRTFGTFRAFLRLVPGIVEITGVAGLSGRMAFDGHGEILVRRSEVWPRYGCLPHRNGKRTVM